MAITVTGDLGDVESSTRPTHAPTGRPMKSTAKTKVFKLLGMKAPKGGRSLSSKKY